jgi:hypothetical protein
MTAKAYAVLVSTRAVAPKKVSKLQRNIAKKLREIFSDIANTPSPFDEPPEPPKFPPAAAKRAATQFSIEARSSRRAR